MPGNRLYLSQRNAVKESKMSTITFHHAYEGGYLVKANGKENGYIERSYDGGWTWQGMVFKYLKEAKAHCRTDLEKE